MDGTIRSEREEQFEELCISVDADEVHEQEAIEFFEAQFGEADFDAAQWLDIALYYSPAVARGIIDMVTPDDKARSNIAVVIGDNLDISYGEDECQQFAETIQFAIANGVPVDLDVVLDGCQRAIDDLDTWAEEEVKEPLLRLRDEILRMQGEQLLFSCLVVLLASASSYRCFMRRPCAGRHLLFFAAAKKSRQKKAAFEPPVPARVALRHAAAEPSRSDVRTL